MSDELRALGLSADAARIYRYLLDHGGCEREELLAPLALTAAEADAALRELAGATLVRLFADDATDRQVWPVNPKIGLSAAIAGRRARFLREQEEIERLEMHVAGLIASHEERTHQCAPAGTEHLDGSAPASVVRVHELAMESERIGLLSASPDGGALTGFVEEVGETLLDREVRLRQIHLTSVRNRPGRHAAATRLAEAGAQVRTAPVLPMELALFDETTAVLLHDPADPDCGVAVVRHPGTVAGLRALFEQLWTAAEPLGGTPDCDTNGLTATERELLRQLAEGTTDEGAARRMGVSLRTVRRLAAQLMERLDARSRFQAGCRAYAYGWLEQPPTPARQAPPGPPVRPGPAGPPGPSAPPRQPGAVNRPVSAQRRPAPAVARPRPLPVPRLAAGAHS